MKTMLLLLMLFFFPALIPGQDKKTLRKPDLMFEGTVLKIGPSPGAGTGAFAVHQLVKYRVNRVYVGSYAGENIVVDHLLLMPNDLKSLKVGRKLCVSTMKSKTIAVRYDDDVVRSTSDVVDFYYVGTSEMKHAKAACLCSNDTRGVRNNQ